MSWTDYLPSWATIEMRKDKNGNDEMWIAVEAETVYPKMLDKMAGILPELGGKPTQETVTLARYMFTRYLKKIMYDNGGTPPMRLHIVDADGKWDAGKFGKSGVDVNLKKKAVYKACGIYTVRPEQTVSLD